MKFATREDIEAPAEVVFAALTDFPAFERAALKRGAEVVRADLTLAPGQGMTWSLRFPVRGRMRRVVCAIERYDRPGALTCQIDGSGFAGTLAFSLVTLSRSRTRLIVQLEIKPQTLPARLLVQAVRLNRAAHTRRFEGRVQKFAADIELRQAQARGA